MRVPFSKKLSRRGFLAVGAVGATTATGAAAALSLEGCSSGTNSSPSEDLALAVQAHMPSANVSYLDVDPSQVLPYTGMSGVETGEYLRESANFELPLGTLLYQATDHLALAIAQGATSKSLIRLCLVNLDSGSFTPILGQARGSGEDFVIYDARAGLHAIIWVECNMVHGQWRVFATPHKEGELTEDVMLQAQLLDEGEDAWEPPQLAVQGAKVYWTVMPRPNGPASTEDSTLKAAVYKTRRPGERAEPYVVYTSHGRMITTPAVSGEVLTIVPRVDTSSVYYQLTALDIATDEVRTAAILPPSLRVSDAVWTGTGFAFGIEANYDYAKGLALFGVYQQLEGGQFLYINKAPTAAPVCIKGVTYVKSTKNVLGLNPATGNAAIIETPENCVSYGDLLAGCGAQNRLVLYTTVTSRLGQERGSCNVRVYDPV